MRRLWQNIHLWIFAAAFLGCVAFTPARMFSADSWTMHRTAISLAGLRGLEIGVGGEVELAPNGRYYSVYGFVEPLLSVPLIWLGYGFEALIGSQRHAALFDGLEGGFTFVFFFNAIVCALIAVQTFRLLNRIGGNPAVSFRVAMLSVFATLLFAYSRDYYVQPLMALLLLCIVEGCAEMGRRLDWRRAAWLGTALSLLLLNRLDGIVAWMPVGVWLLYCFASVHARAPFREWIASLAALGLTCGAGFAVEVWHNLLRSGDPLYLDRRHIELFFYNPFVTGVEILFNPARSLIFYAPMLLLLLTRPRQWRPSVETAFCYGLSLLYFFFYASYQEYYGGVTLGPRLFLPLMPLLAIPLGARAAQEWGNRDYRIGFYALAALGVAVNLTESVLDYTRGPSAGAMVTSLMQGEGAWWPEPHPAWSSGAWAVRRILDGPAALGVAWFALTLGGAMILIVKMLRRLRNEASN